MILILNQFLERIQTKKYRITEHIEGDGESWFYPQERTLFTFWQYIQEEYNENDIDIYYDKYGICFKNIELCKRYIDNKIEKDIENKQIKYNNSVIKKIQHNYDYNT